MKCKKLMILFIAKSQPVPSLRKKIFTINFLFDNYKLWLPKNFKKGVIYESTKCKIS